jgi:transposase-like protein
MPVASEPPTVRCPFCSKKEGRLLSKVKKDGDVLQTFHCPPCKRTWETTAAPFFVEVPRGVRPAKD